MTTPSIRSIDHINLVVRDLERSLAFYCDVLGFRETKRAELSGAWIGEIVGLPEARARVAFVVAPGGEPRLELLQYLEPVGEDPPANAIPNTVGLRHLALRVDDMAAAVAHLQRHGVALFGEPVEVPAGVVRHDAGKKTLVYFRDPDGVILELAAYA